MAETNGLASSEQLRNKVLFTIFILILYRFGAHVPTPGLDAAAVKELTSSLGGIFGMLNTFTGGALEQISVFALGIMPYISASIIFQLLTSAVPHLEALKKEGEQGRKKIQQYTRYATVLLAIVQGYAIANYLGDAQTQAGQPLVLASTVGIIPFKVMTIITLTAGAMFVLWLGEQITERGIGEGASMIIFAGIAASIPSGTMNMYTLVSEGQLNGLVAIIILAAMLAVIGAIIFLEVGQRRITIAVSQRGSAAQQMQQSSYLPLKINMSGVIPPIFASSLLMFPATIQSFSDAAWVNGIQEFLSPSGSLYYILFAVLIIFFCFFYTEIMYPPQETADNLKKRGQFIPGIRAGKSTAEYIKKVSDRITVAGAIYLTIVCLLPNILIDAFSVPFFFGGTSLLILVGVAIQLIDKVNEYRYQSLASRVKAGAKPRRRRAQFQ